MAAITSGSGDPNSYSNTHEARVSHFHLDLTADFERKVLHGTADLTIKIVQAGSTRLVLDVKTLTIQSVTVKGTDVAVPFTLGAAHEAFGQPLEITLPESKDGLVLRVAYETSPDSSAIQWLPPSQTAGKQHPYLFTQCQAIHARALLPCQDSPGNKCTYTAAVTVPSPLVALMSALQVDNDPTADAGQESPAKKSKTGGEAKTYYFNQPVPMPSYLVAVAVGALEKRDIGPRSAVWSEASMVDKGAHEFADTEKFLSAAEGIVGPYVWGRYDILLLPPSFPYGGMENPCLTFVTPTLLAGDRSLANVVAHEIAHSWMGNLVSPKTWEHFWMNEGFTVFLERKIIRAVFGDKIMHLHAVIGWKALRESVALFGADHQYTSLVPDLKGVDPDDAFSSVPYEKGFNFLFYLQDLVGGHEIMDPFLRAHCEKFKFSVTDSYEWKQFFLQYFQDKVSADKLASIDWQTWYKSPGLPPTPTFDTSLVDSAHALASGLASGASPSTDELKGWSSNQVVTFMEKLLDLQEEALVAAKAQGQPQVDAVRARLRAVLQGLDQQHQFMQSKNSEIVFRWYKLCIKAELTDAFPHVIEFLAAVGRMKFVRPLYRLLFASSFKQMAVDSFKLLRANYHSIAAKMVAKDLGLA